MQEKNRYVPLRPEARPVNYSKLDASQRHAFRRVVGMLAGALQEIGTANERKRTTAGQGLRSSPAWLDHDRASRMAFVYGDRGTGKSTVLMSLIKLCSPVEERRQEEEPGAEMPAPTRNSLSTLRGRVVWLEPIDMARAPKSANLLAAILARIEYAVGPFVFPATTERGGRGAGREPLGVLGRYPEGLDPLLTLQRLQTGVAIAWEGNLSEHGGHLDPDSYAVEVMRTERERMTFNVKLSEALDALAAVVPGSGAGGPIFVVALDDVDLNPLRCLETLKLLDLLSVPRVFTIVLGDMDMVEIVLNLKHSGDFSALVGHRARLNPLSMPDRDIAAAVGRLSANAMRKLLPPAQRIRLRSMTRADALNFRPIGTDSGRLLRLHALLHRCPAAIATDDPPRMGETDIYSLRDFLLYRKDKKDKGWTDETEIADEELETCTYAASQILSMPPRWAADWWLVLKGVDDRHPCRPESEERLNDKWGTSDERDKKWKEVIDLLARHCRSVIDEDLTLTPLDRRRFREGWRRSPLSDKWEMSVPVRSTPEMGPRSFFSISDRDPLYPFPRGILLRPGHGWRLQPGHSALRPPTTVEPEQLDEDIRRRLEESFAPETTWALIFLHDLLNLGPGWNLARRSLTIYWPPELWGISAWMITPRQHVWVAWPTPSVLSFWEFDVFLSHWNAALKHVVETRSPEGDQASIEACVYAWLDAGAAVLSRQNHFGLPRGMTSV